MKGLNYAAFAVCVFATILMGCSEKKATDAEPTGDEAKAEESAEAGNESTDQEGSSETTKQNEEGSKSESDKGTAEVNEVSKPEAPQAALESNPSPSARMRKRR